MEVLEVAVETNSDQHLVGEGVFTLVEVAVVGRHQRDSGIFGDLHHALSYKLFIGHTVILDLEEEIVLTKDLEVGLCGFTRLLRLPRQQEA